MLNQIRSYQLRMLTVIISFLKRGRERFPQLVPMRYCDSNVSDRSAFLTVCMKVCERFIDVFDRLKFKRLEKLRNGPETFMKLSKTARKSDTVQDKRSETFPNSRSSFKFERITVF